MIIVKCIKNVEKELEVINSELNRESKKEKVNQQYICELSKNKDELERYLNQYKKNLSELDNIEARLYYKIVYEGLPPTKAINKIADENYARDLRPSSPEHIFRTFYPKIKKLIECQ